MSLMLNYTKAQYQSKIEELQGYSDRLQSHLDTLERYRGQIQTFWKDSNGDKLYQILSLQIRHVQRAQERTNDMLEFYRQSTSTLGASNELVDDAMETAIKAIQGLLG